MLKQNKPAKFVLTQEYHFQQTLSEQVKAVVARIVVKVFMIITICGIIIG